MHRLKSEWRLFPTTQYTSYATMPDYYHVMFAIKALHEEMRAMREKIDALCDDVKVMERGGGIQFILNGHESSNATDDDEDDISDDESIISAQSAPAIVSYAREEAA